MKYIINLFYRYDAKASKKGENSDYNNRTQTLSNQKDIIYLCSYIYACKRTFQEKVESCLFQLFFFSLKIDVMIEDRLG
jgi:hypothetical protein